MLDSVGRVVVFFLFFEQSGLPRPRDLRAVVESPPDVSVWDSKSCRKGQASEVSILSESSVSRNGR
jgi:hypothetical protein